MPALKTRRELIDGTLDALGVLIPGQAPSDENVSRIDDLLDAALALIAADDIYYVQDAGTPSPPTGGQVDLGIFLPLRDCVAWRCAPAFNLAGDPALKVLNDQAEKTLRRIGRPARAKKFLTTDAQLRGQGGPWTRAAVFNPLTGE